MTSEISAEIPSFRVTLGPEELLSLDGKCNPELQTEIDILRKGMVIAQRHALPVSYGLFVARVMDYAQCNGLLCLKRVSMVHCSVSGKRALRVEPKRKTRDNPYKSPVNVPFSGWEFANRNVYVINYPKLGCSNEVLEIIRPVLILELKDIVAQLPENLTGISPIWIRGELSKCTNCGWIGREKLLKPVTNYCTELRCPQCYTKSSVFSYKGFDPVKDAKENRAWIVISSEQDEKESREIEEIWYPWKKQ